MLTEVHSSPLSPFSPSYRPALLSAVPTPSTPVGDTRQAWLVISALATDPGAIMGKPLATSHCKKCWSGVSVSSSVLSSLAPGCALRGRLYGRGVRGTAVGDQRWRAWRRRTAVGGLTVRHLAASRGAGAIARHGVGPGPRSRWWGTALEL